MEIKKILTLIILLLALTACQSALTPQVRESPTHPPPSPPTGTPFPMHPPPPPPTVTPLPSAIPTQAATSPPEDEVLQLYSPLAEHTIEQLPGIVSSPYDPPPPGNDARHHGVDFCYFQGEEREFIGGEGVQAIFSGRVAASIEDRLPYGNMVIIETGYEEIPAEYVSALDIQAGESLYHLYAHFQESPEVALGERVEGGQVLGQVGKTGYNIVVSHLHFETRLGPANAVFESMVYYDVSAAQEEMEAYELWRMSGEFRHFDPMILFAAPAHQAILASQIAGNVYQYFRRNWWRKMRNVAPVAKTGEKSSTPARERISGGRPSPG